MRHLLLPIDPSDEPRTRSAVTEAIRIYREEPVAVHLVRVQPRVSSHVAMFFGTRELQQLQQAAGTEDLQFAQGLLDAAAVPCTSTVLVGRSAETIARAARDLGCDRIVFGQEGPSLASRVFGSLAQQVRHLVDAGPVQVIGS